MSVFRITVLVEEVTPAGVVPGDALEIFEVGLVSGQWNNDTKHIVGDMLDDFAFGLKTAGEDDEQ